MFHVPYVLCESTFNSTVAVRGAAGGVAGDEIRIGDSAFEDCDGGNRIRGSLTVSSNVANDVGIVIEDNVVGGRSPASQNTPAPTVSGNSVTGAKVGQCRAP